MCDRVVAESSGLPLQPLWFRKPLVLVLVVTIDPRWECTKTLSYLRQDFIFKLEPEASVALTSDPHLNSRVW